MTEEEVARLYAEHGYVLFRRCLAYLGERARAQDALQEVFVRALRGADGFRGDASPRTWLCRIADHLCVDLLRRDRRNPVRVMAAMDADDHAQAKVMEAQLIADDGDALRSARELMASLDPEDQRLAVLCFLDELSQDEIAHELGLSRRTIGKRIKALRRHARQWLEPEDVA